LLVGNGGAIGQDGTSSPQWEGWWVSSDTTAPFCELAWTKVQPSR
jgi:hypothetical protein